MWEVSEAKGNGGLPGEYVLDVEVGDRLQVVLQNEVLDGSGHLGSLLQVLLELLVVLGLLARGSDQLREDLVGLRGRKRAG